MPDSGSSIKGVLLPANRAASLRVVIFAIALASLGFVTQGFIWISEVVLETSVPGSVIVYLLCAAAILGAVLNGYANDDTLVSVCIAIAPVVGFGLFSVAVFPLGISPAVSSTGGEALRFGGGAALVGTVGGLIGVWVGRRYGAGRSSPSLE